MASLVKNKIQLFALIGAALFQCCMIGTLINSVGVILSAAGAELQMDAAQVALFYTMRNLAGMLGGLLVVPLYYKVRAEIMLPAAILVMAISHACMAFYGKPWQFYLSALVCGMVMSLVGVIVPHLLTPVFHETAGAAIGFAMAFSGVGECCLTPWGRSLPNNTAGEPPF